MAKKKAPAKKKAAPKKAAAKRAAVPEVKLTDKTKIVKTKKEFDSSLAGNRATVYKKINTRNNTVAKIVTASGLSRALAMRVLRDFRREGYVTIA